MEKRESLEVDSEPYPDLTSPDIAYNNEEVKRNPANFSRVRYMSSICRNGPYPISRHVVTDPFCYIAYIIVLVLTLVLFCINYFSTKLNSQGIEVKNLGFFSKIAYTMNETIPEILLSTLCIVAFGIIFFMFVITVPAITGFLIIGATILALIFVVVELFSNSETVIWSSELASTTSILVIRIFFIIAIFLSLLFIAYLLLRRSKKLVHLPSLMKVIRAIIVSTAPLLPVAFVFVGPFVLTLFWLLMTKIVWVCVQMDQQNTVIPMGIVWVLVLGFWWWSHGTLIATTDYFCQSWILHWYYNHNNDTLSEDSQPGVKQNWKMTMLKKYIRYHWGTCAFGAIISPYILESFIYGLRTFLKSSKQNKINNENEGSPSIENISFKDRILCLSRFCYVETVMECLSFCEANVEGAALRSRIKQKLPEVYMLGHFIEQNLKTALIIIALFLWFIFTYSSGSFLDEEQSVPQLSPFSFIFFCLLISFGLFYEVSTSISHIFGMISDTAVIAYCIDCEVERVHYHENFPKSVPQTLKQVFKDLHIEIQVLEQNYESIYERNEYEQ